MDLQPGLMLTPAIRLDRVLGRGGMGTVWVADHLRLKVKVVVKFLALEIGDSDVALARFQREAAAATAAKSPHVVQILDFGHTEDGQPFIAMERLEGEDLGKYLAREERVAPSVLAKWLTQACKGLTRVHARGIVHRDIKPENIFLCDIDGEVVVKLLDFGVAKVSGLGSTSNRTRTTAFMGTLHYMSPEQTDGAKNVDLRTDLWSLAVVAYQALTGVRPFESDNIFPLLQAIRSQPIVPPSEHCPELGSAIDAWMMRALARDRVDRFASAREMAEEFARAVASCTLPGVTVVAPSADRPSDPDTTPPNDHVQRAEQDATRPTPPPSPATPSARFAATGTRPWLAFTVAFACAAVVTGLALALRLPWSHGAFAPETAATTLAAPLSSFAASPALAIPNEIDQAAVPRAPDQAPHSETPAPPITVATPRSPDQTTSSQTATRSAASSRTNDIPSGSARTSPPPANSSLRSPSTLPRSAAPSPSKAAEPDFDDR